MCDLLQNVSFLIGIEKWFFLSFTKLIYKNMWILFWQLNRFLLMFVIKNKYYYNYSFFVLFQISLILVRIVACTVENTWAHDLACSNRILIGFDFVAIFERIFVAKFTPESDSAMCRTPWNRTPTECRTLRSL